MDLKLFLFSTDFIYKKSFIDLFRCSKSLIVQDIYIYKYIYRCINTYIDLFNALWVNCGWNSSGCDSWLNN